MWISVFINRWIRTMKPYPTDNKRTLPSCGQNVRDVDKSLQYISYHIKNTHKIDHKMCTRNSELIDEASWRTIVASSTVTPAAYSTELQGQIRMQPYISSHIHLRQTLYFCAFPSTFASEKVMEWSCGNSLKASLPTASAWAKLPYHRRKTVVKTGFKTVYNKKLIFSELWQWQ